MIEERDAIEKILATTPVGEPETSPLPNCRGRVLFEDVRASVAMPRFDQSAMDGYALRGADVAAGVRKFRVIGASAAGGQEAPDCGQGEAVRVLTGARIPGGADTVVMQEDVSRTDEDGDAIELQEIPDLGEFVRPEGAVLCEGQTVGSKGDVIGAGSIALFASQGVSSLTVARRPRVAIVTTGDELVPAGTELGEGQIYNTNAPMLKAAVEASGGEVADMIHSEDDLERTEGVLRSALASADVVLVAGGVSVGDRDFVKPAATTAGCETVFWRVNVKPGKPLFYATARGGKQLFGLPGNPVSALVCFALFVLPALHRRLGIREDDAGLPRSEARLSDALENGANRPHYVRGTVRGGEFVPRGLQESHGLAGLAEANALVRVPENSVIEAGQVVEALLLGPLAGGC